MRATQRPVVMVSTLLLAIVSGRGTAQDPLWPRPAASDAADTATWAPPLRGEAARLRAGSLTYDVIVTGVSAVTGDGAPMAVGTHRVDVQEASFAGMPAWRVVDHRDSMEPFVRITASDTVLLGRAALAPQRWDARAGGARFVAAFTSDSVFGGASSALARRTFTLGAPHPLLTSEGALDAVLQTVSFHSGWAATATMLVADLGGGRLVPVRLDLASESSVDLSGEPLEVWVVLVRGGGTERWIWIDKRTQVVVRTETSAPHMPGVLVTRVLAHPPQR